MYPEVLWGFWRLPGNHAVLGIKAGPSECKIMTNLHSRRMNFSCFKTIFGRVQGSLLALGLGIMPERVRGPYAMTGTIPRLAACYSQDE